MLRPASRKWLLLTPWRRPMFLSVLILGGGLLLAMCGICALAERYQRARRRPRKLGSYDHGSSWLDFTDTSHVLDSSTHTHDTWGWGDGSDWSCGDGGGGDCGGD